MKRQIKGIITTAIATGVLCGGFYAISRWNVIWDTHLHIENNGVVAGGVTTQSTNQAHKVTTDTVTK